MNITYINTNEMREAAEELKGYIDDYESAVSRIVDHLNDLVDNYWQGDARNEFVDDVNNEDMPRFQRMIDELRKYHQAVLDAAARYDAKEAENVTLAGN